MCRQAHRQAGCPWAPPVRALRCFGGPQVWQNVLCLLEYSDQVVATASGRTRVVLVPGKRILIDLSMCSAIFAQYGFDKDGLMPYVVFTNVGTHHMVHVRAALQCSFVPQRWAL